MPISMNPRVHYVTQSGLWDCPFLGPLTDKAIARYQRKGKPQRKVTKLTHKQLLAKLLV
jgi:hypothetical protein